MGELAHYFCELLPYTIVGQTLSYVKFAFTFLGECFLKFFLKFTIKIALEGEIVSSCELLFCDVQDIWRYQPTIKHCGRACDVMFVWVSVYEAPSGSSISFVP